LAHEIQDEEKQSTNAQQNTESTKIISNTDPPKTRGEPKWSRKEAVPTSYKTTDMLLI